MQARLGLPDEQELRRTIAARRAELKLLERVQKALARHRIETERPAESSSAQPEGSDG